MKKLYVILSLLPVFPAFAVTCPNGTSAVSGVDAATFVSVDGTGHCPSGYAVYDSPSHLSAYFSGTVLPDAPTLCGAGEYMANGVCTSYTTGRCDTGYVTTTTDGATVGAVDNTGHCAPGYATMTIPTGSYIISTGIVADSGATLCGTGEYMNNGVCTSYDNTACPTGWVNYTTTNTDTFVPTAAGACGTNYNSYLDTVDCGERSGQSFCGAFCPVGESLTWGGSCVGLCSAGVTEFHIGSLMFPIYATKTTDHAIHIRVDGQNAICYVNLAAGSTVNALHVNIPNVGVFHTTR